MVAVVREAYTSDILHYLIKTSFYFDLSSLHQRSQFGVQTFNN